MKERERKERKKDSIVQTLAKVTVCPSKDQVQVSRETNSKTSRQTLAKQSEPHVWVCVYKNLQRKAFSCKYACHWENLLGTGTTNLDLYYLAYKK